MSILIRGMEMPTSHPICVVIDAAGQARRYDLNNDRYADKELFEAVPVPPHGRLIDADAYKREMKDCRMAFWDEVLDSMPVVIPASEEGET